MSKIWAHISADVKAPLTVAEFRQAFDSWWDNIEDASDEKLASVLPADVVAELEEAVRVAKFDIYKKLYWEKLQHTVNWP